jgi:transposase InsO family protein
MAPKKRKRKRSTNQPGPYSFEFRLKVVRMYLEEAYPIPLICEETGVGRSTISNWVRKYRQEGEDGLRAKPRSPLAKSPAQKAVAEKIIGLKQQNPTYGPRRIADILKRFFLIRTSPTTVHKTLDEQGLVEKQRPKRKRNPAKPRFFERSKPNQLWQSDICTFRLAGKNAYLIGFIDDYSRYITGLGFFRSQTAVNVLETYRRAVGEYGVPREMLTDNGRQYVNWRGTTTFQRELQKDRVKHIRSRPHHPMTLGKIERFWKTILQEFLMRAQFDSFEDAQQRIAIWVSYYNHRRPHQGIKGLCPADRYFEIQNELKKTIARGIEENALELALRGRPRDPFYMVGRMNGQNVVIRAEKGKLRMQVDGEDEKYGKAKELIYRLNDKESSHDNEEENQSTADVQRGRETQGGLAGLDGSEERDPDLQGDEPYLDPAGPLAESGDGGYACSIGAEKPTGVHAVEQSGGKAAAEETLGQRQRVVEACGEVGSSAAETPPCIDPYYDYLDEQTEETARGDCQKTGGDHHAGSFRIPYRYRRCGLAGGIEEDLLQVGEQGVCGNDERSGAEESRPSRDP